jgi:membrane-associated phospholipid phosphatase
MIAVLLAVWTQAGPTDKLDLNPPADAAILAISAIGVVVPELFKTQLVPAHCRICDGPDNSGLPGTGGQGSLNGVDAFFHDSLTGWLFSRGTADTVSTAVAFGVTPAYALTAAFTATGPHATDGAGARAAVIVVESAAVSAALVQALKIVTVRRRPFVRYGDGTTSGTYDVTDRDHNEGFPSGHTVVAASVGTSAAMTATLEESRAAPWLWGAAAVVTVSTGALRIMAEKHYFTDVLAGAAIGAGAGVVLPILHRRGSALSVGAQQGPGLLLSGAF